MTAEELIEEQSQQGNWPLRFIADLLTVTRFLIGVFIVVLGLFGGAQMLSTALIAVLCGWATDWVDGPIARSSGTEMSWVGRIEVVSDMTLVYSFYLFLVITGLFPIIPALVLTAVGAAFVLWKPTESVVQMVSAPVFALPIVLSFNAGWVVGACYMVFIVAIMIIRWDRIMTDAKIAHQEASGWTARD